MGRHLRGVCTEMGLPELMVVAAEVPVHWCALCQWAERTAGFLRVSKHWDGRKSPPVLYPVLNFAHKEMAAHSTTRLLVLSTAPAALWLPRAPRSPWAGLQGFDLGLHQPQSSLLTAFRPQILHLHFLLTASPQCQRIISVWVPLNKTFICSPSPPPSARPSRAECDGSAPARTAAVTAAILLP